MMFINLKCFKLTYSKIDFSGVQLYEFNAHVDLCVQKSQDKEQFHAPPHKLHHATSYSLTLRPPPTRGSFM